MHLVGVEAVVRVSAAEEVHGQGLGCWLERLLPKQMCREPWKVFPLVVVGSVQVDVP